MAIFLVVFFSPLEIFNPPSSIIVILFGLRSRANLEMYTKFTLFTIRTEPGKVKLAQPLSHMSFATSWTFLTEACTVVVTYWKLGVFFDVHIQAFVSVLTVSILVVELTFTHLSQVVFM